MLDTKNYNYKTWGEKYPNNKVSLKPIIKTDNTWNKLIEKEMKKVLLKELKASRDTRIVGPDTEIFDSYIRYSPMREFPDPRIQN